MLRFVPIREIRGQVVLDLRYQRNSAAIGFSLIADH
jgi:hypothetical protein